MLEEVSPEISPTSYDHDTAPGPCPGCPNFFRCKRKLLACQAFAAFVRRDRHYSIASRLPLAETYREVFG